MSDSITDKAVGGANRFLNPGSATARLHEEASRYIPGGTSRIHYHFRPYPLYVRSAAGCYVTDVEGVERLDFLNLQTALIHGHGHPAIKRALVEQIEHGTAYSEPSEPEVRLARLMVERVQTVEKIRFGVAGTEAMMMAVKLARAYTGRSKIAKFEGHYHGYYDYVQVSYASTPANWGPAEAPASVASTGGLSSSVEGEVLVLPYNNREAVEQLLAQHGHRIAALLVDPLPARAGLARPVPGFFDFLRQITRDYGIVLVFDEVVSFRLAYGGAQEKYGGEPDLTAFGKIMGGGMPIGALGGRAEIMDLLDPSRGAPKVVSGGTFSGNPLAAVAGLAAMEMLTPEVYARLDRLGEQLRARADAGLASAGVSGHLTGDGSLFRLMFTAEPVIDYRRMAAGAAPERMAKLHLNLLDEGIILAKNGLGCLTTPMGEAEIDRFISALERALARL